MVGLHTSLSGECLATSIRWHLGSTAGTEAASYIHKYRFTNTPFKYLQKSSTTKKNRRLQIKSIILEIPEISQIPPFCMKYKHLRKENQSEILTWFQIKTKSPCTVKILGFLYRKDSSCREKIRVPSKQVAFG